MWWNHLESQVGLDSGSLHHVRTFVVVVRVELGFPTYSKHHSPLFQSGFRVTLEFKKLFGLSPMVIAGITNLAKELYNTKFTLPGTYKGC